MNVKSFLSILIKILFLLMLVWLQLFLSILIWYFPNWFWMWFLRKEEKNDFGSWNDCSCHFPKYLNAESETCSTRKVFLIEETKIAIHFPVLDLCKCFAWNEFNHRTLSHIPQSSSNRLWWKNPIVYYAWKIGWKLLEKYEYKMQCFCKISLEIKFDWTFTHTIRVFVTTWNQN